MHHDPRFERFTQRYSGGDVPWDSQSPPPEVIELVAQLPPARALDLGCGYGRTSIYLAQAGWQVDGVDFVPAAVDEARARAKAAGVHDRTRFHVGSVTQLDFLEPPYTLAIDIGCMHSLEADELRDYHAGLLRLLLPGATYLLFARLRDPAVEPGEGGPRGIPVALIDSRFQDGFRLTRVEHGVTEMQDQSSWDSAWFWYERLP